MLFLSVTSLNSKAQPPASTQTVGPEPITSTINMTSPCRVVRTQGTVISSNIYLAGSCKNTVPSYVALFNGTANNPDYIYINRSGTINNSLTLSWWMYPTRVGNGVPGAYPWSEDIVDIYNATTDFPQIYIEWRGDSSLNLNMCKRGRSNSTPDCSEEWIYLNSSKRWINVAITYDRGSYAFYIDGKKIRKVYGGPGIPNITISNPRVYLSYLIPYSTTAVDTVFGGYLSDVQIYNASLSSAKIALLYSEGLLGAPVDLKSISSWWQLNGNANDYGGNNYTGVLKGNVTFVALKSLH